MLFSLCYVLGVLAGGRASIAILRPAAESAISAARRFRLVSSLLALKTHQIHGLRPGYARKTPSPLVETNPEFSRPRVLRFEPGDGFRPGGEK
jgi:hypothetical protein